MSSRLPILCVFGTRPDAIKMAPLVLELRSHAMLEPRVVVTGQHREQLDQVLRVFGIEPEADLAIMRHGQTLAEITTRALEGVTEAIRRVKPAAVLAQGDTTTTFVASLAAFYERAPFGHVEAGLRTGCMYDPFPEEMNRVLTARIASYHFAPTEDSRANLLREGTPEEAIWVTGNTGIDALLWVAGREWPVEDPAVREALAYPGKVALVTAHRRENWGEPMGRICRALQLMAAEAPDLRIVFSMHRNPALREQITGALGGVPNISLIDPPDYAPFVKLMQRADIILTDSGGVQEEAPSLGVPVLVLRNTTERPEGVSAGCATLVGTDIEAVLSNWRSLMSAAPRTGRAAPSAPANPYGDGLACARIAQVLEERLCR